MTSPTDEGVPTNEIPTDNIPPERTPAEARASWVNRKRDRIAAEIERNRRGDHKVPTWVLVVILVAFVAAWTAVIVFS